MCFRLRLMRALRRPWCGWPTAPGPAVCCNSRARILPLRHALVKAGDTLTCPRQSGNQPILNIDPQTGDLFVEDHSNYRLKQYGIVYRIDQDGNVLQKWPPLFFNDQGLQRHLALVAARS